MQDIERVIVMQTKTPQSELSKQELKRKNFLRRALDTLFLVFLSDILFHIMHLDLPLPLRGAKLFDRKERETNE